MSFCCTQWGGISNLIVPVGSSLRIPPLYEHLLTLVEPDVVVSYLPADSEGGRLRHDKLQARLSALWPHSDVALHAAAYEKDDMTAHPLSVLADDDVAAHQFLDRRFQGPPSDRMPLLAMFGQVYPGQEDDYARLLQYGRLPVGLDSLDLWAQQMRAQPFSSPINLTGTEFTPTRWKGLPLDPMRSSNWSSAIQSRTCACSGTCVQYVSPLASPVSRHDVCSSSQVGCCAIPRR